MNDKRLTCFLILLIACVFGSSTFAQTRRPAASPSPEPDTKQKQAATAERDSKDLDRIKMAQHVIDEIFGDAKNIQNPIVRMRTRIMLADAYWLFQPNKAREILSEDFSKLASISVPENEGEFGRIWTAKTVSKPDMYKGKDLAQVKSELRRDLIASISAHDAQLAKTLLEREKAARKNDSADEPADEVLASAGDLAATDADAAESIIKDSLKSGIDEMLAFTLIRLRETSPDAASGIFNQVVSQIRTRGDLWEFQKLVPYILPTELDRLVGGKSYLSDVQRMKDAKTMIDYAAQLLFRRIQTEPPANMTPDVVRKEYFLWRNLQETWNDLSPESLWLVNTRLRQLTASPGQTAPAAPQSPWSQERLDALLAAAKTSAGDKRDSYLESAAFQTWRFGQGDLDEAISIAQDIGSREIRDLTTGTLYFQAGIKSLRNEGPDPALKLARQINLPIMRTRLYLRILNSLRAVKAKEQADFINDELLNWLRNSEKDADTAWAALEYLQAAANESTERSFLALDISVHALNGARLDPPEKLLRQKTYWYPEFHDFRRSFSALAREDFDRGLELIRLVSNKEVAIQVQAAFCADYLKNQSRKTSTKVASDK